jgi:hypothetical protein
VDQVGQGRQGLLHVDRRVGAVHLVEVEVVGLQAAQGVLGAVMIQRRELPRRFGSSPVG